MAPPAFTALAFEAALERSRTNQSILIVDAMAAWCGPCRQMDATTWTDDTVVARLTGGSSFAIQIDVDEEADLAAQLAVQAMPTLIAFASGVEHDRIVGARGPQELLEWLDTVERGERFEDAQRAKRALVAERRRRATTLLAAQQYDEALAEYTWLWSKVRDVKLVDEMRELAAAHVPAHDAFTALRDAAAPKGESHKSIGTWLVLNEIIDDIDAPLGWYAAYATELPATRAVADLVDAVIVPLMMRRDRWCEAGVALTDPRGALVRLVETSRSDLRTGAANLVRALYAAGRDDRASDLEYEAESVDSSAEMAAALAAAKALGRNDRANRPS